MKTILLFLGLTLSMTTYGQINISLLHQLVEDSKTEYEKQLEAKGKQAKNAINEEVNRNLVTQVKNNYKTVQARFAKLTVLFDAAGIAVTANPLVKSIVDNQQQIVFYCQKDPSLIPFALKMEKIFVKQAYALMNYLIGLSASIGDLNQMKISERRILFQHILHELRGVHQLSLATSKSLESYFRRKSVGNPHLDYLNNDLNLINEILTNIQIYQP